MFRAEPSISAVRGARYTRNLPPFLIRTLLGPCGVMEGETKTTPAPAADNFLGVSAPGVFPS